MFNNRKNSLQERKDGEQKILTFYKMYQRLYIKCFKFTFNSFWNLTFFIMFIIQCKVLIMLLKLFFIISQIHNYHPLDSNGKLQNSYGFVNTIVQCTNCNDCMFSWHEDDTESRVQTVQICFFFLMSTTIMARTSFTTKKSKQGLRLFSLLLLF